MTYVLPGELVPAQHVNLKLGPGLLQETTTSRENTVLATKAGEVRHTQNNKEWWVESNSWRVCLSIHLASVVKTNTTS